MTFEEIINKIRPADREAMENAQKRWKQYRETAPFPG